MLFASASEAAQKTLGFAQPCHFRAVGLLLLLLWKRQVQGVSENGEHARRTGGL